MWVQTACCWSWRSTLNYDGAKHILHPPNSIAVRANVYWIVSSLSVSKGDTSAVLLVKTVPQKGQNFLYSMHLGKFEKECGYKRPCRIPMEATKGGKSWPWDLTLPEVWWQLFEDRHNFFLGTSLSTRHTHNIDLSAALKAGQMSKNTMVDELWCSNSCRKIKIWPMHPWPVRLPACCSLQIMTEVNSFHAICNEAILRWLT